MTYTRRTLLRGGVALTFAPAASMFAQRVSAAAGERRLVLRNLHTGEHLETTYCSDGRYVPAALLAVQTLLRDHRNDEHHVIDPLLLDHAYDVARQLGVEPVYGVIAGYRSRQTTEPLRERGGRRAPHSLHLEGRAMDVRLAGIDCATLAGHARQLRRGGVGYYRAADCVHLDTGAYRTWCG